MNPPEGLLDRPLLRRLADEKSFAHGEAYFNEGRVRQLRPGLDRVSARVEGTHGYRVKLWQARGELQWSCTCPPGQEAVFCKHAVAVGLAWLASAANAGGEETSPGARRQEEGRRELIQEHLATLDRERLLALLLEATDYDDILHRRLLLESIGVAKPDGGRRRKHPQPPDFSAYRQLLREAIETHDYVDHVAMADYAQGVEEAIQPFGDLLEAGFGAAVAELCEFALVELDRTAEMLDGSDGFLNRAYDTLQYYHLEACRAANLDVEELAERLLRYELEGGLGVFNNAVKTYADVLGPRGLTAWRHLLMTQWENALVQTRAEPAGSGVARPIDHRRYQLQALMESLAESEGNTDALIRVKARELSSPHDYLSLTELCLAKGRRDEALAWAERGLQEFPHRPDAAGLREVVSAELNRRGRHAEAVEMAWRDFAHANDLESFRQLKAQALPLPEQWPVWRAKALGHLRRHLKKAQQAARRSRWARPPDHSVVVEILLDEQADEEAWAEAQQGGCHPLLYQRLATRLEQARPGEALRFYHERLESAIARGGRTSYEEATELLKKMSAIFSRLDRAGEFAALCTEIRTKHRRKRGFIKLLERVSP